MQQSAPRSTRSFFQKFLSKSNLDRLGIDTTFYSYLYTMAKSNSERMYSFEHGGKKVLLSLPSAATTEALKAEAANTFNLAPESVKVITKTAAATSKLPQRVMVIGTPATTLEKQQQKEDKEQENADVMQQVSADFAAFFERRLRMVGWYDPASQINQSFRQAILESHAWQQIVTLTSAPLELIEAWGGQEQVDHNLGIWRTILENTAAAHKKSVFHMLQRVAESAYLQQKQQVVYRHGFTLLHADDEIVSDMADHEETIEVEITSSASLPVPAASPRARSATPRRSRASFAASSESAAVAPMSDDVRSNVLLPPAAVAAGDEEEDEDDIPAEPSMVGTIESSRAASRAARAARQMAMGKGIYVGGTLPDNGPENGRDPVA